MWSKQAREKSIFARKRKTGGIDWSRNPRTGKKSIGRGGISAAISSGTYSQAKLNSYLTRPKSEKEYVEKRLKELYSRRMTPGIRREIAQLKEGK